MKTLLSLLVLLILGSCSPPPTVEEVITQAIKKRRTILLYYTQGDRDGAQIVEPHLLGTTHSGDRALRAWLQHRVPKTEEESGWRLYMMPAIRSAELAEPFAWPRADYDSTGGKIFQSVEVAL